MKLGLFGLALAVAINASAETPSGSLTTSAPAPSGKILGGVELRPSYRSKDGEFHTENWAQLGYQFAGGTRLLYRQEFNSNLYDPSNATQGAGAYAMDGSLRAKIGDIWKDGDLSLNYEARAYLPTFARRRDAGLITGIRNYFRLKKNFGNGLAVVFEEIPIYHGYSKAGLVTAKGAEANPIIEQRAVLALDWDLGTAWNVYVPVTFQNIRYRDFQAGAKNNDRWGHFLTVYPEVTYKFNKNASIGVAFYSLNLVNTDLSGTTLGEGLKSGVTQFVMTASI